MRRISDQISGRFKQVECPANTIKSRRRLGRIGSHYGKVHTKVIRSKQRPWTVAMVGACEYTPFLSKYLPHLYYWNCHVYLSRVDPKVEPHGDKIALALSHHR